MSDRIKIVVLGTGQMGSGIIKLLRHKHGLELVGVYGQRASRVGLDVGTAIGLEHTIGVTITHDLEEGVGGVPITRKQVRATAKPCMRLKTRWAG